MHRKQEHKANDTVRQVAATAVSIAKEIYMSNNHTSNNQTPRMFEGYPELLTYKRAADACSVCSRTLMHEAQKGNLKVVRIGKSVRIPRSELVRFLERSMN